MKLANIKFFIIIALFTFLSSKLNANICPKNILNNKEILPKCLFETTINYSANKFFTKSSGSNGKINSIFPNQSAKINFSFNFINNLQINLSYNGINYNLKNNKIIYSFSKSGAISLKSLLCNMKNYKNILHIIIPVNFEKQYIFDNIILNNIQTYVINDELYLNGFDEKFILIKFKKNNITFKVKSPISLNFKLKDNIYSKLSINLFKIITDLNKNTKIKISSFMDKIPTSIKFIYNINNSMDITTDIKISTYFKDFNNKNKIIKAIDRTLSSLNFGVSFSYRENII